ncbi:MAG: FtsW/RodA/SpoVE family cell cycle protein [Eubacterium sp.]
MGRTGRTLKNKKGTYFDYSLLFIIIFLLCFGLVMLYSTSSYVAFNTTGDAAYYLKKQAFATALGLILMTMVAFADYHIWAKFTFHLYVVAIVAILLVITPLGVEYNGARRWVGVGPMTIQPAEIAKIAVIVFLAWMISKCAKQMGDLKTIIKVIAFAIPFVGLIAIVTSNLSTAIIIMGIAIVMVFVASPKYSHFLVFIGVAAVGIGAFLLLGSSFRLSRVMVWLDPESYSADGGYQVLQGLYAIGSGGLFGKGLGQSVQKLGFVPEAQNDMIFTIICEELGLFGAIAIILLFGFMVRRFMVIANNAPDTFGSFIVIGVMGHIAIQVILNIAVVTNSIPNTGVTLPFISYGGTSIMFLLIEMGMVLSVSRSIKARA